MTRDPVTMWNGPFPYDVLAAVGVHPGSSMQQVVDSSFDLLTEKLMTQDARHAWEELRSADRRLFVDFFLYAFEASTDSPATDSSGRSAIGAGSERGDEFITFDC